MSDSMEQKVAGFIHLHGLFAGAGRILLAVSGGADSTALLYVMQSLRTDGLVASDLVCAHINHQLRGAASDEDERFVIEQASLLGLPVVTRTVDVRTYAKAHRLSVETAARRLRIEGLSEIASASGCTWVATGHQKNDNAETVLQRLRRGTGFRGLAGIWPVRQFDGGPRFARPLLNVTREEIVIYLRRREFAWREDHTNIDLTYTRNYIRHRLLPALQQESHGSLAEALSELAASARRLYERVQHEAEEAILQMAQVHKGDIAIAASELSSLPELVAVELVRQALVKLGCGEQDLTQDHYRGILQLARGSAGGELTLPAGFTARRQHEQVILSKPAPRPRRVGLAPPLSPVELSIPGETRFAGCRIEADVLSATEVKGGQYTGQEDLFCECFDLDRLKPPVIMRTRRAGDRFQPLGMDRVKKLGKFLTTAKVPPGRKERIIVFADQEEIIWVCPVRIADPVKVTGETQRVLMVRVTCQNSQTPLMQPPA